MNRYSLPKEVYFKTIWTIRDYQRLVDRREELLHSSPPPPDGQPHGAPGRGNVDIRAVSLAEIDAQLKAIERALNGIPKEYRKGIWNHIQLRTPFPIDAAMNTYKKWNRRFVYFVALNMHWI